MKKHLEISDPNSCLNKAHHSELVFTMLERDPAAPYAIRKWAQRRCELGKNKWNDPQIIEALMWADAAQQTSKHNRPAPLWRRIKIWWQELWAHNCYRRCQMCGRLFWCNQAHINKGYWHEIMGDQPVCGGDCAKKFGESL